MKTQGKKDDGLLCPDSAQLRGDSSLLGWSPRGLISPKDLYIDSERRRCRESERERERDGRGREGSSFRSTETLYLTASEERASV